MASHVLWVLLLSFQIAKGDEHFKKEGIMDRISSGMKFATDFLGSESVALKVADFVVRAFQTGNKSLQTANRRWPQNNVHSEETFANTNESNTSSEDEGTDYEVNESQSSPLSPLRHLVRLLGLQPNQISAVAVNALVFVAQLISSFFAGPKRQIKPYRSDDPISWIHNKNSRKLQDLLTAAKNTSLPDTIDDLIQQHGAGEDTSCIRLLVCKITPFISRMQKSVFDSDEDNEERFPEEIRGSAVMYRHLPTAAEIKARGDICEQQYRDCNLNE